MKTTKVNEYDKEAGERCIAKITFDEEDLREIVHKTLENNDFVQVVRCKDCRYNKGKNKCLNEHSIIDIPKDDDFCSYGERKEQNNDNE